jgi:hypothetical protein
MPRQQKITFGEMRTSGASRIIVHCGDYKCGHSVTMYPALWPDNVRLSDLEERFVCTVCGHRGADVRPLFVSARMGQTPRFLLNLARSDLDVWLRSDRPLEAHKPHRQKLPQAGLSLVP